MLRVGACAPRAMVAVQRDGGEEIWRGERHAEERDRHPEVCVVGLADDRRWMERGCEARRHEQHATKPPLVCVYAWCATRGSFTRTKHR